LGIFMSASPELLVKAPGTLSAPEFATFIALVRAGGEVIVQGLPERVLSARALVLCRVEGLLVGIGALKQPQASYQRRIGSESGFPLPAAEFPYELGWVYVSAGERGKGLSFSIAQAALSASSGAGVFATSRTDNLPMHRSLEKLGFLPSGQPFVSGRGKHSLQLFVRHAQQFIPPDLSRQAAPVR
jgi:hypothetical protein